MVALPLRASRTDLRATTRLNCQLHIVSQVLCSATENKCDRHLERRYSRSQHPAAGTPRGNLLPKLRPRASVEELERPMSGHMRLTPRILAGGLVCVHPPYECNSSELQKIYSGTSSWASSCSMVFIASTTHPPSLFRTASNPLPLFLSFFLLMNIVMLRLTVGNSPDPFTLGFFSFE